MELSYTYFKSQFSSNVEDFSRKNELKITILGQASFSNWINNDRPFPRKSQIITITDQKCKFIESLQKKMKENSKIFGFYVSISSSSSNFKYGILTPTINAKIWNIKLFDKMKDFKVDEYDYPINLCPKISKITDVCDILKGKYFPDNNLIVNKSFEDLQTIATNSKIPFNLNLTPPKILKQLNNEMRTTIVKSDKSDKMLRSIDPMQFLLDRYYTTLYKPSVMLEHFAKSSIPKMNLLRRDDLKLAEECLSNLMIESLLKFDNRYTFQISESMTLHQVKDIWMDTAFYINESEEKYRLSSFEKLELGSDQDDGKIGEVRLEKINTYLNELKIRDLKLQILINMELLKLLKSGKTGLKSSNDSKVQKSPEKRPRIIKKYSNSLVGKKKRLIPTLLGTVIPAGIDFDTDLRSEPTEKVNKNLTQERLKKMIEGLFEKLCVWDAIMGLAYKDINSSWGFLSNCLVPFYDKYSHKLISDLAIRSRGPAFILKLKSRREKKEREEKRKKKEVEKSTKKVERKSTTIDLSKLRLERSYSSFSSTTSKIDLSRKTFDMVKSFNETQPLSLSQSLSFSQSQSQLQISDLQNTSQSIDLSQSFFENGDLMKSTNGFMNSKKRKLNAPKSDTKSNRQHHTLVPKAQARSENKILNHKLSSDDPIVIFYKNQVIEATPRHSRIQNNELSIIQETPKLAPPSAIDRPNEIITSSPILIRKSPVKTAKTKAQIAGTPESERVQVKPGVFEIGSSPLKLDATPLISDRLQVTSSSPLLRRIEETPKSISKSYKRKLNFD